MVRACGQYLAVWWGAGLRLLGCCVHAAGQIWPLKEALDSCVKVAFPVLCLLSFFVQRLVLLFGRKKGKSLGELKRCSLAHRNHKTKETDPDAV